MGTHTGIIRLAALVAIVVGTAPTIRAQTAPSAFKTPAAALRDATVEPTSVRGAAAKSEAARPAPAPSPTVTPDRTIGASPSPAAPPDRNASPAPELVSDPGPRPARQAKAKVDVVFLLDTTGSMGGLLEGAKTKIWSIANKIVSGKPTPEVRIGLIAYRDRGDAYVTQVHDLTADIDAVYAQLKLFKAAGGGDGPEHVNQALSDMLTKMTWSDDPKALKLAFLVGDFPPHDDYDDGLNSVDLAKKSAGKGIRINTLRCGTGNMTEAAWRIIAEASGGRYASIPQTGGVVAVATPHDAELAKLNAELTRTTVGFGRAEARSYAARKASDGMALAEPVAAERAAFASKASMKQAFGEADLVGAVKDGRVELEKISKEELPDELREKSVAELKAHVETVSKKREELGRSIRALSDKRDAFLREATKTGGTDSFDQQVTSMIADQAKDKGIEYH